MRIRTIEEMQDLARMRGGKCLSPHYINNSTKLLWECKKLHHWESAPANVIAGKWCHECGGSKKKTIEDMQKLAHERDPGGKCLSSKYKNTKTKLWWICSQGHKWESAPINIIIGHWCHECGGSKPNTIEDMHKLAESRGFKCLSKEYINNKSKLKWGCPDGHSWLAKYSHIKDGSGCPHCHWYYEEEKCRYILEYLLETKFIKDKKQLNGLELDGYSEEYNLAFEYNGVQHFEYKSFFHSDESVFEATQQRDEIKGKLCSEKGIKLLLIPDFAPKIKGGLVGWILYQLKEHNINLKRNPEEISFLDFIGSKSVLKKCNNYAEKKGGKCLSTIYLNKSTKLKWECKSKHRWEATYDSVITGRHWCSDCYGNKKYSIEDMQKLAEERDPDGRCLSAEYENTKTKLWWQCSKGHQWETEPQNIIAGHWCQKCGKSKPLTIEDMHELAESRGFKCLSKEYINVGTRLLWECQYGHQWCGIPGDIKYNGSGCPECYRIRRQKRMRATVTNIL